MSLFGNRSQAVSQYLAMRRTVELDGSNGPQGETAEHSPVPTVVAPIGPGHWVSEEKHQEVIDLLNPVPAIIIDKERIAWALDFGFVGGTTTGVLGRALSQAPIAASDWDPAHFADTLFVSDLIDTCMKVRIEGFSPTVDKI